MDEMEAYLNNIGVKLASYKVDAHKGIVDFELILSEPVKYIKLEVTVPA
jgi:hypothetical protein